jgi:hypothetical protein
MKPISPKVAEFLTLSAEFLTLSAEFLTLSAEFLTDDFSQALELQILNCNCNPGTLEH